MAIEEVSYSGWQHNLRLWNEHAEVVITLDVGPRVISYRRTGGENVFKTYPEQMGGVGEKEWKIRGGHRLWLAPEDKELSYIPDNNPVAYSVIGPNAVELVTPASAILPIKKSLTISLDQDSDRLTLTHRAENCGPRPYTTATWALTVMAPGGIEIIPQPILGEHPRDLLPNRNLILWPYTDMSDKRWTWGTKFIRLKQDAEGKPLKIGLAHRLGWVGYALNDSLFIKKFIFLEGRSYPDGGCNFETFTNHEMLEVESLSPLMSLEPGESVGHDEEWSLSRLSSRLPVEADEENLLAWVLGQPAASFLLAPVG